MYIGPERRTIYIEPIEDPVGAPAPLEEPRPEPVPEPAAPEPTR
jgi:hypothetical protein